MRSGTISTSLTIAATLIALWFAAALLLPCGSGNGIGRRAGDGIGRGWGFDEQRDCRIEQSTGNGGSDEPRREGRPVGISGWPHSSTAVCIRFVTVGWFDSIVTPKWFYCGRVVRNPRQKEDEWRDR